MSITARFKKERLFQSLNKFTRPVDNNYLESIYYLINNVEYNDKNEVINNAKMLLGLIYIHSARELPDMIPNYLAQLPGGEDWKEGRR